MELKFEVAAIALYQTNLANVRHTVVWLIDNGNLYWRVRINTFQVLKQLSNIHDALAFSRFSRASSGIHGQCFTHSGPTMFVRDSSSVRLTPHLAQRPSFSA